MNELEAQITPAIGEGTATVETLLGSMGAQADSGVPKKTEPYYSLYSVLVNQLGWTEGEAINTYSHEQWKALTKVAIEIAVAIHTSTEGTDAEDLVSLDFHHLVRVIRRLKKANGLTELGVMILLDNIIENRLYKDLYHCNSPADFFRCCENLLGFSSSRARDFQVRGHAFKQHWQDIRFGCGDVPGISLEELCLRHLTKLSLYDEAVALFEPEGALRIFSDCSYRDFSGKVKSARAKSQSELISKGRKSGNSASNPATGIAKLDLSGVQLKLLHIVANGGSAKLLAASTQSQIDEVLARFIEHRDEKNIAIRAQIGHKLYDLKKPFEVNKELMGLNNVHEIIDRICSGIALAAPRRRTIAILTYRLKSEPYFRAYWRHPRPDATFRSFSEFAKADLGMGEELRDYLRVGRNLAKFGYILDGLDDLDTDTMFYKLRYIDDAIVTHLGDIALIRARLANLSSREFAKFARDVAYDQSTTRVLVKKYQTRFLESVAQINSFVEKGFTVDVVECFAPEEASILDRLLGEVQQEGAQTDPERDIPQTDRQNLRVA
ncbi:MAG TPA: hypothetical protein VMV44_07160 [Rectinemataceae bacterium]|nr:hypothetical protein [Rectinemataceae bacterium]